MNRIQFLPNQNVLLQINFRTSTCTKLLGRVSYTKDMTKFYTINGQNYGEIQSI